MANHFIKYKINYFLNYLFLKIQNLCLEARQHCPLVELHQTLQKD